MNKQQIGKLPSQKDAVAKLYLFRLNRLFGFRRLPPINFSKIEKTSFS